MKLSNEEIQFLTKKYNAKRIIVFRTEPNTPWPVQEAIDISENDNLGSNILVVYTTERAHAFVGSTADCRIGYYKIRLFDPDATGGVPKIREGGIQTHDMRGYLNASVSCGYGFSIHLPDDYKTHHAWTEAQEMTLEKAGFVLCITPPENSGHIYLYFRIQALLDVDYEQYKGIQVKQVEIDEYTYVRKNVIHSGWQINPWIEEIVERVNWYPDGSTQELNVVYDNPFGPYSNYDF